MKMFIPALGMQLTLSKKWSFALYSEKRNATLLDALGYKPDQFVSKYGGIKIWGWWSVECKPVVTVTLPAKTVLSVDRIYIRRCGKEVSSFDSVSFRLLKGTCPQFPKGGRFWAKLSDVNTMEFVQPESKP